MATCQRTSAVILEAIGDETRPDTFAEIDRDSSIYLPSFFAPVRFCLSIQKGSSLLQGVARTRTLIKAGICETGDPVRISIDDTTFYTEIRNGRDKKRISVTLSAGMQVDCRREAIPRMRLPSGVGRVAEASRSHERRSARPSSRWRG